MRDREGRKDEGWEQHPGLFQKLEKQRTILDFGVVLGETAFQVMKYKEMGGIHLVSLPLSLEVPEGSEGGTKESKKR